MHCLRWEQEPVILSRLGCKDNEAGSESAFAYQNSISCALIILSRGKDGQHHSLSWEASWCKRSAWLCAPFSAFRKHAQRRVDANTQTQSGLMLPLLIIVTSFIPSEDAYLNVWK